MTDLIDVVTMVADCLDACGIPYSIGGSVASAYLGEPRSSIDADVVVDMTMEQAAPFTHCLGDEFYADVDALRRAVTTRTTANVIHRASSVKVDLFIAHSLLDRLQLERRRPAILGAGGRSVFIHTAEDILLQKLHWFRLGGEVSDRQWRDVLGVLLVQGTALDFRYLSETAARVDLSDLLSRARREAHSA